MIFLTVGTQLPFDRLTKALDQWNVGKDPKSIFGQIADPGPNGYQPKNYQWKAFVEPAEFTEMYQKADFIVAYAGMGSIISALTHPKPIVIVPRRADLLEHRNDHQLATAIRFKSRPGVYVAETEDELGPLLDKLISTAQDYSNAQASEFANPNLIEAVRNFILQEDGIIN